MENQVRKAMIELLQKQILALNKQLWELQTDCPHEIIRKRDSAWCSICERLVGWWCPNSPDHLCHYAYGDSGDWCIHCGEPEERK